MKEPESMEELVYFTRRDIGSGKVMAWVSRRSCPKCGKAPMGKPVGTDGHVKIRAKEYVCPSCGHTVEKQEYEESLTCEIKYTCPHCGNIGEIEVLFKRKKYQGIDAVVFNCEKCGKAIAITKKMKKEKK